MNIRNSQLNVQGVILDRISFSSGKLEHRLFVREDQSKALGRFKHLLEGLGSCQSTLTEANAIEVFWRTLIANVIFEEREATPEGGEWFLAYMDWLECLKGNIAFPDGEANRLARKFFDTMFAKAERRSLCTTEKGHLCLAPLSVVDSNIF
jgi:hypothetical protein